LVIADFYLWGMKKPKKKKIIKPEEGISAHTLLNLLGESLLEDLARRLQSDKWVIKLETVTVFKLLLYSLLDSERMSLRTMETQYHSVPFRLLEKSVCGQTTRHSSIRDRLVKIDVRFFEELFNHTVKLTTKEYGSQALNGVYNIKRYDSTMVAVFSHLLEGMKVGNTSKKKNQVKLTTELVNDFEVRMRFFKDQDHLGEEVALKEMIQAQTHDPKSLIVFDKGLKSRKTLCEFNESKTQFVTRLNDNARYLFVRKHEEIPGGKADEELLFLQDSIVQLYGTGGKLVKEEFRMIEVQLKKGNKVGKKLFFLTNITFLSAQEIAEIYRRRWDIEVFFRFVKQEMNLTHFVCNDLNAIQVMIYCTLIAAMLILIYKKMNGIQSYKTAKTKFFKELQASVMLEVVDKPNGVERLRSVLREYINKGP